MVSFAGPAGMLTPAGKRPLALWLAAVLALLAPCRVSAGAKAEDERAAPWIAQLGSRRYVERQAAARALDRLGMAALPALTEATRSPDPEIRRHALALVKAIRRRDERDKLLAPTPVHLVCRDTPIPEALAALAKQAGLAIEYSGTRAQFSRRKITLDTGKTTFWPALDRLCREAGLAESRSVQNAPANGNPRLVLVDAKTQPPPTCYFGAMRFRALPGNSLDRGMPRRDEGESLLVLEASLEPRADLGNVLGLRLDRVVDERGTAAQATVELLAAGRTSNPYEGYGRYSTYYTGDEAGPQEGRSRQVLVRVHRARVLKELRGTLTVEVKKPSEPLITVENILKAAGKSFAGPNEGTLNVVRVSRNADGKVVLRLQTSFALRMINGGLQIGNGGMRIRRNPGGPWETVGIPPSDLRLVDARGRSFPPPRVMMRGTTLGGGAFSQHFELTYVPDKGQAEPAKLVYTGVRTIPVDVPFTLKDVHLP
jgi:hypothetical protein